MCMYIHMYTQTKGKSPEVHIVMDTFATSLLCIPLVLIKQRVDIKYSKGQFSISKWRGGWWGGGGGGGDGTW